MITKVIMPQGGQDIDKGTVVQWHRRDGDEVKKGDVICEVETEKTVIEVSAPQDGVVLKTYVAEGEEVSVFSVIAVIGNPGEPIPEVPGPSRSRVSASGSMAVQERPGRPSGSRTVDGKVRASPKAKRLAEDMGVSLAQITGTGPQRSITADDVLQAAETISQSRETHEHPPDHGRIVPMTKVGKATARRMLLSKQSIPHFYVTVSADMTAAQEFRSNINARLANPDTDGISVTDLVTRACVLALKMFPQVNSTVKDESNLILWDDINVGIATATDAGLVVPVLEGADAMPLAELAKHTRHIVAAARTGRQVSVAPARFTISNMGMLGVDNFIAIINSPEVAILSVSSVKPTVVPAVDGSIRVRQMMNITLSMDHRVGDGVLAARFLNHVKALLEDPRGLG